MARKQKVRIEKVTENLNKKSSDFSGIVDGGNSINAYLRLSFIVTMEPDL